MKIVIDDPLARMQCRKETEIDNQSYIRFELNEKEFKVMLTEEGIIIHESSGSKLIIQPISSNKVEIR